MSKRVCLEYPKGESQSRIVCLSVRRPGRGELAGLRPASSTLFQHGDVCQHISRHLTPLEYMNMKRASAEFFRKMRHLSTHEFFKMKLKFELTYALGNEDAAHLMNTLHTGTSHYLTGGFLLAFLTGRTGSLAPATPESRSYGDIDIFCECVGDRALEFQNLSLSALSKLYGEQAVQFYHSSEYNTDEMLPSDQTGTFSVLNISKSAYKCSYLSFVFVPAQTPVKPRIKYGFDLDCCKNGYNGEKLFIDRSVATCSKVYIVDVTQLFVALQTINVKRVWNAFTRTRDRIIRYRSRGYQFKLKRYNMKDRDVERLCGTDHLRGPKAREDDPFRTKTPEEDRVWQLFDTWIQWWIDFDKNEY